MNNFVFTEPASDSFSLPRWQSPLRVFLLAMALLLGMAVAGGAIADELPVNINTAAAEELSEALTGVGLAKARLIVEYREMHGPFEHVDELAEVRGIGAGTVDKNRERIVLH